MGAVWMEISDCGFINGRDDVTVAYEEIQVSDWKRVKDTQQGNASFVKATQCILVQLPFVIVTEVEQTHGLAGCMIGQSVMTETVKDGKKVGLFNTVVDSIGNGRADCFAVEACGFHELFVNLNLSC